MLKKQRILWLGAGVLLCFWVGHALAQQTGPQDPCRHAKANVAGIARADITVNTAAVTVLTPNNKLCGAILINTSATQAVRCAGITDGVPTATAGFKVPPGAALTLGLEAQEGWSCIRDTSATGSANLSVGEVRP